MERSGGSRRARGSRPSAWVWRAVFGGGTAVAIATTAALITSLVMLSLVVSHATRAGAGAAATATACSTSTTAVCQVHSPAYSHSWYITNPSDMPWLAKQDAQWLSEESAGNGCAGDFLTILDFGRLTTKYSGNASPLDDYATTFFGQKPAWRTFRQIEQMAKQYLDVWYASATDCPHLHLALGTSNYAECADAVGTCATFVAGQQWDVVVHDVMAYVSGKGYGQKVLAVWGADDLEGSWDPWTTTLSFLHGMQTQEKTYATHAHLVDFGDADANACAEVTGDCTHPWTEANIYSAAWGVGWDLPLPEIYTNGTAHRWDKVTQSQGPMPYLGAITECSGQDPLPAGRCWVQFGAGGACQYSPTMSYAWLQAAPARQPTVYMTNMQWPHQQVSAHSC
jgi:hypothetical protein